MKSDSDYLSEAGIKDTEAPQAEASAAAGGETSPSPEVTPEATSQATQPTTAQEMFELMGNKYPTSTPFSLTHGGKIMKVPYNSLVQTYRQAAHMEDKWAELKKAQAESQKFQTDFQRFKSFHDRFGAMQDWSEKNPQEWQRLHDLWQNKDQHLMNAQMAGQGQGAAAGQNPFLQQVQPILQKISQLEQKFGEVSKVRDTWESQVREQEETADVNFVKDECLQFSKQFPEIQLAEQDPDGVPLWAKIVQWGNANGYREFTPAAYIFLKDRIADAYSTRGRAEALRSQKQDFQNGIVKRSATPITGDGKARPANLRKMSYGELAEMAKGGSFAPTGT